MPWGKLSGFQESRARKVWLIYLLDWDTNSKKEPNMKLLWIKLAIGLWTISLVLLVAYFYIHNSSTPDSIVVKVIPHYEQRYNTIGDYWETGHSWQIRISNLGKWQYETAVALHEIIEKSLCKQHGITDQEITNFDEH